MKLKSFSQHLDEQYGPPGTPSRDAYEEEFEAFKLGVLLQELRKDKGLTQEELASKVGTSAALISKIENHTHDIKLSTLMQIIKRGFGGSLKFSVDI